MTATKRAYKGKDVEMLTAVSAIVDHAIDCKEFLISKRSTWADPFFPDLKIRILSAFSDILGVDSSDGLTPATRLVNNLQANASTLLSELKVQIDMDFKKTPERRDEILKVLGFSTLLKDTQKGSQESMVELLYKFKLAITEDLKSEITAKGTDPATIESIVGFAEQLNTANITQESIKSSKKEITASAVSQLNEIYDDVISIAQIAANFYKDDAIKQGYFSYSATLNQLSTTRTKSRPTDKPQS
jgi:hypothetical protein